MIVCCLLSIVCTSKQISLYSVYWTVVNWRETARSLHVLIHIIILKKKILLKICEREKSAKLVQGNNFVECDCFCMHNSAIWCWSHVCFIFIYEWNCCLACVYSINLSESCVAKCISLMNRWMERMERMVNRLQFYNSYCWLDRF